MSKANDLERLMLELINEERTSRGLDAVDLELRLNDASEDHSDWMLTVDRFSHTGIGGSDPGDRMRDAGFTFSGNWTWGENIAWQSERGAPGLADDVENLHQSLMNSPGHRANILNPNFDLIGIGIEFGDYNGWNAVMVTQNFARTSAAVQIDNGGGGPQPNTPPVVSVGNFQLAGAEWVPIGNRVQVRDADNDAPVRFQIKSGDSDVAIRANGERIDASGRHVFDAADLDTLMIRVAGGGMAESLAIRVHDGTEWSDWDRFRVTTPSGSDAPDLTVTNFRLTDAPGERVARLEPNLTVDDPDGDTMVWYELLDRAGTDNFQFANGSRIDAGKPYRISADQLDNIRVVADDVPGKTALRIRAFDGDELSGWEVFRIATLADADAATIA